MKLFINRIKHQLNFHDQPIPFNPKLLSINKLKPFFSNFLKITSSSKIHNFKSSLMWIQYSNYKNWNWIFLYCPINLDDILISIPIQTCLRARAGRMGREKYKSQNTQNSRINLNVMKFFFLWCWTQKFPNEVDDFVFFRLDKCEK